MSHVALAHYPEGAGHATRMMAIARGFEKRGATVSLAGGGPGRRFYESNGYDVFEPPVVDYVGDFQGDDGPGRGLARVVTNSLPASVDRVRELVDWLREEDPDALVTDDMFAAAASVRTGTPLYVFTHNAPGLYRDIIVRLATRGLTLGQRLVARRFFYPTVWPPDGNDPRGVSRVPPVALEPPARADGAGIADPGIVVVPSTYSTHFDRLVRRLRESDHEVTHVGDPEWTILPSLLPLLRRADAVVCAGYSTVMEAAVAGTPCIVCPATNEQVGVADRLTGVSGFAVVESHEEVPKALSDPPAAPRYPNGVATVVERVLHDVREPPEDVKAPPNDRPKPATGRETSEDAPQRAKRERRGKAVPATKGGSSDVGRLAERARGDNPYHSTASVAFQYRMW